MATSGCLGTQAVIAFDIGFGIEAQDQRLRCVPSPACKHALPGNGYQGRQWSCRPPNDEAGSAHGLPEAFWPRTASCRTPGRYSTPPRPHPSCAT